MRTLQQVARLDFMWTSVGLLILATGCDAKDSPRVASVSGPVDVATEIRPTTKPVEPEKVEQIEYDLTAIHASIDGAIAEAAGQELEIQVLKLIRRSAECDDTDLIFFSSQLSTLPPEIGLLTKLTGLHLDHNRLATLPPEIGKLTNLTGIFLFHNQLATLPPEIGKLTNLTGLYLSNNQLAALPSQTTKLVNLKWLFLYDNQFASLPTEICKLTNLRWLHLYNNQLTTLPPEIGKLTNLTELLLDDNQLTKLPPEIGKLTKLKKLDLSRNSITDADLEHLKSLKNLSFLDISYTQITKEGAAALKQTLPNCNIRRWHESY